MTILPTKRAVSGNNNDEPNENSNQAVSRHRDEHNVTNEASQTSSRRSFQYNNTSERKERNHPKRYKETPIESSRERRERERQKQRELRRKRKHEHQAKRAGKSENQEDDASVVGDAESAEPSTLAAEKKEIIFVDEDGSGCNSEDEYNSRRTLTVSSPTDEEWARRDAYFSRCLMKLGFEIKKMHEDGACLFRAIADQVYGDQELHSTVRSQCMDYIVKNQDFFAPYVTEDFDKYVERKRRWHVHGNHLEIQAISEMYNRTIEVYCYHTEPINIFNASSISSYEPIRVSYHRMCHYNSITNPKKPSILVGLGLPNYCTRCDVDGREVRDAVRQSEELLIEQTMLEDKIKATDWEATNEALEEQVARESYIQYYRDAERRLKTENHSTSAAAGSSSTITSTMVSSPRSRRGSMSPKGSASPKGNSSPKNYPAQASSPRLPEAPLPQFDPSCLTKYSTQLLNSVDFGNNSDNATFPLFGLDCQNSNDDAKKPPASSAQVEVAAVADVNEYPREAEEYQDWDETIMAQVLAESQLTYFEDLKRQVKKRYGSPGPSTSR